MLTSLVVRLFINAVALWAAAAVVPGILLSGEFLHVLLVAAIFGLVNALIRPIILVLSIPFLIITLGLFTIVVNALMLLLTSVFTGNLEVAGFWPAVLGAILISIVSFLLSAFIGERRAPG